MELLHAESNRRQLEKLVERFVEEPVEGSELENYEKAFQVALDAEVGCRSRYVSLKGRVKPEEAQNLAVTKAQWLHERMTRLEEQHARSVEVLENPESYFSEAERDEKLKALNASTDQLEAALDATLDMIADATPAVKKALEDIDKKENESVDSDHGHNH